MRATLWPGLLAGEDLAEPFGLDTVQRREHVERSGTDIEIVGNNRMFVLWCGRGVCAIASS